MTDTSIQETARRVEPFVRDYLRRWLLAKGRALFDWLNNLPQDERDEAVECVCSFSTAALTELRGALSAQPHLMYEAMEQRPALGKLVDECAAVAARTLTREDTAIYTMCMDIIRQANVDRHASEALEVLRAKLDIPDEPATGGRGLIGWTPPELAPLSLAAVALGEEHTVPVLFPDEEAGTEVSMLVIAPEDATDDEIRATLQQELGLEVGTIIRSTE